MYNCKDDILWQFTFQEETRSSSNEEVEVLNENQKW